MTEEINDEITEAVGKATHFLSVVYDDGKKSDPKQFEDDNFIHISRGKHRFVFYNGQDKGAFTEKDVKRFAELVDRVIKKQGMKQAEKINSNEIEKMIEEDSQRNIAILKNMKELIRRHFGESVSQDTEIAVMLDYADYLIEQIEKNRKHEHNCPSQKKKTVKTERGTIKTFCTKCGFTFNEVRA
jgi:hypothetical protein